MTMPHLMNCPHSESGWCLACVSAEHEKREDQLRLSTWRGARITTLEKALDAIESLASCKASDWPGASEVARLAMKAVQG